VFVSNSFYEGWSVAASEAAWTGLPVVLSETGGAAELVGPDSARGVLVTNPCGDALEIDKDLIACPPETAASENESALAAALVGMVRDRVHWEEKRVEIRNHARGTMAPIAIGRRYLEALGEAAAESPR
jgi:glycosyltransferase involved in cell wall biosynthesis